MQVFRALESGDYTIEEIDAITGPATGRPKSATFRTMDIAGIDVLAHVARNLAERLPALRKIQADYPASAFLRQVNSVVLNILIGLPDKKAEIGPEFAKVAADATKAGAYPPERQLQLLSAPVSRALDLGIVIEGADTAIASIVKTLGTSGSVSA